MSIMSDPSTIINHRDLSKREEIALKREEKRIQDAMNLTFKPNIQSDRRGRDSEQKTVSRESSFQRLYKDAINRKQTSLNAPAEIDNHQFRPQISAVRSASVDRNPVEVDRVVDRLYRTSTISKSLIPQPVPTVKKRSISAERDIHSTLFLEAKSRQEQLSKLKAEHDIKAAKEIYTFNPKISPPPPFGTGRTRSLSTDSAGSGRFEERQQRLLKIKEDRISREKARHDEQLRREMPFKPKIAPSDYFVSTRKVSKVDVLSRLTKPLIKEIKPDPALTFAPRIPSRSSTPQSARGSPLSPSSSTPSSSSSRGKKPVHERLFATNAHKLKALEDEVSLTPTVCNEVDIGTVFT